MFANPEVSAFVDRLIGGQTPRGGAPPPAPPDRQALARALLGNITKPIIRGSFAAPAIEASRRPLTQPLPSTGVQHGVGAQETQEGGRGASGLGTGASALESGIEKIGAGLSNALDNYAAQQKLAALKAAFPQLGGGVPGQAAPQDAGGMGAPAPAGRPPIFAEPGVASRSGTGTYSGGWPTVAEAQAYAESVAPKHGIAPGMLSALIAKEYGGPSQGGSVGDKGSSFGPLQLHYGGVPGAPGALSHPGMGDDFTKAGLGSAADPANWKATIDFAASQIPKTGWTPWTTSMGKLGWDAHQGIGTPAQNAPVQQSVMPSFASPSLGQQGMVLPPQAQPDVSPLALALSGGQMPPVDPNFGSASNWLG